MRIDRSFTVALPLDDAWKVLRDVKGLVPCLPGVELHQIAGDECRGVLTVDLGGMTARYEGSLRATEVDEAARRVVLRAAGRDTVDGGDAATDLTLSLRPVADGRTEVVVEGDLTISGPVADAEPAVLADVSATLLGGFARCMEGTNVLLAGDAAEPAATPPTPEEIVADEIGDLAVEDPERAAQLVSAVTQGRARTAESRPATPPAASAPPAPPAAPPAAAGGSVAERAVPAAIVGVFLLQVLPKGRMKRLGLAVLGSALVAGMVAGKQQQKH